jgi:hypothetical protein
VNHLGFWCDDVAAAARRAIDAGAGLLSLTADAEGNATARLLPSSTVKDEHLQQLGLVTFVNPGVGNLLIEYVGRAGEDLLRNWFKGDFENVVVDPPWVG